MSTPEFTREVVRIDFPVAGEQEVERSLTTQCRVEVPGIYRLRSSDAQTGIWQGADDNRGCDAAASAVESPHRGPHRQRRRGRLQPGSLHAARRAVQAALVSDFRIPPERLNSAGFGAHRPVETNETIAGARGIGGWSWHGSAPVSRDDVRPAAVSRLKALSPPPSGHVGQRFLQRLAKRRLEKCAVGVVPRNRTGYRPSCRPCCWNRSR